MGRTTKGNLLNQQVEPSDFSAPQACPGSMAFMSLLGSVFFWAVEPSKIIFLI